MTDLFSTAPAAPLAELLRPTSLSELVGQVHLVGPKKPLRLALETKRLHSCLLYGPPGVGKTTLARLCAKLLDCEFVSLSAVTAGAKEIRDAVARAQSFLDMRSRATVVFVDEVHRFNKAQQDLLLPHVESGLIKLVGATTEDPGFSVNSALLSRLQVYKLLPLSEADLTQLYQRAVTRLDGVSLDARALGLAVGYADGDARRFLNTLEQLQVAAQGSGLTVVGEAFVRDSLPSMVRRFSEGELYDQISAFQKAVRGSSPNGALYWLARMLDGGADALYIARRLIVIASEDIGNADPRALQLALNAAEAYERLGAAEGERALAQAATYLALAPKSNAVYRAWNEAKAFVQADQSRAVPLHLRNAPTQFAKEQGHKEGYVYSHDAPNAYSAGQTYFPDDLPEQDWYRPAPRGLEIKLAEKLQYLRSQDAESRR